jgi:periplasmic divalent cation tolerance protein
VTAIVVLCTVGKPEDAERIGRLVVERGLAACANILPGVMSIYRWQGAVETAPESLLLLKTTADRFEALREAIVSLHPYEVPEVVALNVAAGHAPYLAWLQDSVARPLAPGRP